MDDSSYYFTGEELTFSPTLPPTTIATSTREDSPSTEVVNRKPFTKNYVESAIQQTCATMIIEMIFAYPRMMTRRETLPPFMHAFSPADDTDNAQNKLPGHLVNCMAIAQLFAVRTADTQSFVGTTIQAEIRGFRSRLSTFNAYDSMSALQACLLYLVIRAVEDAPQEAKDDIEMLLIYDNVCQRAMETVQGSCQTTNNSPDLRWKDWIFMESIRRIGCVWFVLGLVFHIRTGKPCFLTDHYREILLPCTKSEWEAKTEGEWKKENEIAAASNGTALQTFGDLIDAHRHLPGSQMFDKLARWNAGVDNLGVMLNLAVRMV
ncbi:uncharacterized protein LY89DRAFT_594761 [Mollisia scopiformis]|uniref:Xylanolytic transcriptional activator regulatory domain-containing protein n=1 Tax=Mollisia scopiformis TaxID=149040 RepID=A0A194WVL7_MOLSC|nr:uncharacterized protein LY89DRAFT_594761 [Mollisia scopiformis]KUJ11709.1 hypothetical protein LY89DRAFT_594761 [Mollisia scopiformis]